jgi:hypothetical protein
MAQIICQVLDMVFVVDRFSVISLVVDRRFIVSHGVFNSSMGELVHESVNIHTESHLIVRSLFV